MKLTKTNSFGHCYPDLISLWSDKNSYSVYDVTRASGKSPIWQCVKNKEHEFSIPVYRVASGERCPFCSGHRASTVNSLANKEISKEWDYAKNTLMPKDFTVSSRKKAFWICSKCNFEYIARIDHRTISGSGCPSCRLKNQNVVYELLQQNFPELIIHSQKLVFKNFLGKKRRFADFWFEKDALQIWVEYDGEQHFKPVKKFGGKLRFDKQKENDAIDKIYSQENNIILHRIKYSDDKEMSIQNLKDRINNELRK